MVGWSGRAFLLLATACEVAAVYLHGSLDLNEASFRDKLVVQQTLSDELAASMARPYDEGVNQPIPDAERASEWPSSSHRTKQWPPVAKLPAA